MTKETTGIRTRNLFDPESAKPFKLSRSRLERFTQCPRCFYLDRRLGIDRPDTPPWNLNSAVDALFKKEFDVYRERAEPHPIMREHGLDLVPFRHNDLDKWRNNFQGVRVDHEPTGLIVFGAVDDIWVDRDGTLYVVDYKSTSIAAEITFAGNARNEYKRQLEIYQWLLRQNGFDVSDTGYFVYANGRRDLPAFEGRLEFVVTLHAYEGRADWVEECVIAAHRCLTGDLPPANPSCSYCLYRSASNTVGAS